MLNEGSSPSPKRWRARTPLALAASLALGWGCSETDDGRVSFKTEIHPLLQRRCVLCHYPESGLDVVDPFDPERGLFEVKNTWFEGHGGLEYNVVAYDPEASFLLQKVTNRELVPKFCNDSPDVPCRIYEEGLFMPPQPPLATSDQIQAVETWILEGAGDTPTFREQVVPMFGEPRRRGDSDTQVCSRGGYERFCVRCFTCHYEGAPTTPNLEVPVGDGEAAVAEWLQTIVGVKASFRSDLDLIAPGDPEGSFLLMKMKATEPSSEVGSPMPLGFEALSEDYVALLRRWIEEGARNN